MLAFKPVRILTCSDRRPRWFRGHRMRPLWQIGWNFSTTRWWPKAWARLKPRGSTPIRHCALGSLFARCARQKLDAPAPLCETERGW